MSKLLDRPWMDGFDAALAHIWYGCEPCVQIPDISPEADISELEKALETRTEGFATGMMMGALVIGEGENNV